MDRSVKRILASCVYLAVCAALVVSREGAIPSIPTFSEVEDFIRV